ncbi:UDP-galactopyranose mutase [Patescibacteria group bacterium]|nr:UDP-galactopyranose mutase [Patescibacteria group bacterium]
MKYDSLIVGCGLAGSVIAERLSSQGEKVLVIDKRDHIGGNCYDFRNDDGLTVHKYGPHLFHTDDKKVYEYLSRFTEWRPYELRVAASLGNELYPLPINRDTLNKFFKINLRTEDEAARFIELKKEKISIVKNAKQQVLSTIGREIYDAFFKNYTIKQWKTDPENLDASVTARIPIRTNTDDRYFTDKYQAMPLNGYAKMFESMLKNVDVKLNENFENIVKKISFEKMVYTGPIDEFFGFKFGRLPYRSLDFQFETLDREFFQEYCLINYPNEYEFTRITEIKHATGEKNEKTVIAREYPIEGGEPSYPIPNDTNHNIYGRYEKEAKNLKNVWFAGRLGQYKYFNMDQTVASALETADEILLRCKIKRKINL